MPELRRSREWEPFLKRTIAGKIVPFVSRRLDSSDYQDFIGKWSDQIEYPFNDRPTIDRIAQFYSATVDQRTAKQEFLDFTKEHLIPPDFEKEKSHPLQILAGLNLPVYVTSSYSDFLEKALEKAGKSPRTEICYWNEDLVRASARLDEKDYQVQLKEILVGGFSVEEIKTLAFDMGVDYQNLVGNEQADKRIYARELIIHMARRKRIPELVNQIRKERVDVDESIEQLIDYQSETTNGKTTRIPSVFDDEPDYEPNFESPLVYHLFGYEAYPSSLVLTEDDYIDFLVRVAKDPKVLNPAVTQYFTTSSLLLLGYRLYDWDFRSLFRGVIGSSPKLDRLNLAVQLNPEDDDDVRIKYIERKKDAQDYFERYFHQADFWVYLGKTVDFVNDLVGRLETKS